LKETDAPTVCRYVTGHLGQLSLPALWGSLIEYRPIWLGFISFFISFRGRAAAAAP